MPACVLLDGSEVLIDVLSPTHCLDVLLSTYWLSRSTMPLSRRHQTYVSGCLASSHVNVDVAGCCRFGLRSFAWWANLRRPWAPQQAAAAAAALTSCPLLRSTARTSPPRQRRCIAQSNVSHTSLVALLLMPVASQLVAEHSVHSLQCLVCMVQRSCTDTQQIFKHLAAFLRDGRSREAKIVLDTVLITCVRVSRASWTRW